MQLLSMLAGPYPLPAAPAAAVPLALSACMAVRRGLCCGPGHDLSGQGEEGKRGERGGKEGRNGMEI